MSWKPSDKKEIEKMLSERTDEMFDPTDFDRDQEDEKVKVQLKKQLDEIEVLMDAKAVDHPSHYNQGKIEVIDFIQDQKLDFCLGNAIKYICRAQHKGKAKQDIAKAIWYLQNCGIE